MNISINWSCSCSVNSASIADSHHLFNQTAGRLFPVATGALYNSFPNHLSVLCLHSSFHTLLEKKSDRNKNILLICRVALKASAYWIRAAHPILKNTLRGYPQVFNDNLLHQNVNQTGGRELKMKALFGIISVKSYSGTSHFVSRLQMCLFQY